jgi:hypothetical protein
MITPPKTYEELNALIINKVEENYNLEYKSADALLHIGYKNNKKDGASELIKDVSAMANAAGGIVIYGIKEFDDAERKHLPEKITPIKRIEFSKERIEQLINGNIMPKIEGLLIHPIELENSDEVAYVIEIPQGKTAHQNTKDQRYYKRQNFEATAMLDFEIRDIMNRGSYPKLVLEFEIIKEVVVGNNLIPQMFVQNKSNIQYYLKFVLKNVGNVYANYVNYFIEVNKYFLEDAEASHLNITRKENDGKVYVEFYGENTIRDIVDTEQTAFGLMPKYGTSRFDPILPRMKSRSEKLKIKSDIFFLKALKDEKLSWKIYADNAPISIGSVRIGDLLTYKDEINI